ncbi:hypothetical protein A4X13_0g4540 [Tilletia indica]|uniref:N-acetyltransferase domain-containing protein n=1 Tax=Tilletia indica TaxID=43049 RepID=A0A177TD54_9BASI|nr:hypothetical protein A4X13_0g4540 [Tilletia indica]
MSPYGTVARTGLPSGELLPSSLWPTRNPATTLSVHHLNLASTLALPVDSDGASLIDHLRYTFSKTIEDGRTYPQEESNAFGAEGKAFEAYFFAADDVFVGVVEDANGSVEGRTGVEIEGTEGRLIEPSGKVTAGASVEAARKGRTWKEAVGGFYYVKPNYPGRSSHICNAGFVVSHSHRGLSIGSTLGKSYLHYAPRLGYKASVFNLVYVNNIASVRIWDNLGFVRAGLIPKAGRLRCQGERGDRGEEEYVDAVVFYKSFE